MGICIRKPLIQLAQLIPLKHVGGRFHVHSVSLVIFPFQNQRRPPNLISEVFRRCSVHLCYSRIFQGFRNIIEFSDILFKALMNLVFLFRFILACPHLKSRFAFINSKAVVQAPCEWSIHRKEDGFLPSAQRLCLFSANPLARAALRTARALNFDFSILTELSLSVIPRFRLNQGDAERNPDLFLQTK